ncbi:MAG: type II toxin-antitoxin system HipA family toxin [Gemmatimonadales bacterium]|nr:type II toxin-antitoxin system HipA family toxin [Gemmatimonadales bacterium]MDZ4391139.1 type II toxin-antitoxin system HipA family toxin [Gemmatimonadales bacterium]
MPEVRCLAEVRLWGRTVGAIAELDDGTIVSEYAEEFRRERLEISPIHLPVRRPGPVTLAELARKPAFNGLPGVFADSLPDAFGNLVIRAYYAARGEDELAMSPVQRLLYVGERAIGAFTYHPAVSIPTRPAEQESLELASLVRSARQVVAGSPDVAIPEIYLIGSSAGGMRPKALVWHHPATGEIRSGHAPPKDGAVPSLLKFDGVGDAGTSDALAAPAPFNRVEAAYAAMAREAGITLPDIAVLPGNDGYAHLLITRFDLEPDGSRIHQHTLGGLLHVDYNDPGASSYEEFLRTALRLGAPPSDLAEIYLRMVFNVLAVNQDDHVKNHSFHMRADGGWRLAPAYDLTFAQGAGFTRQHQMRVNDKLSGITRADLLAVAGMFGIKAAPKAIARVEATVADWPRHAAATEVPGTVIAEIGTALAARRREVGL